MATTDTVYAGPNLDLYRFSNKLPIPDADLVSIFREAGGFARSLFSQRRILTYEMMDRCIDRSIISALHGYDADRLWNYEAGLREAISNGIRHPREKGQPYRPLVSSFVLEGALTIAWTEIQGFDPVFDPRRAPWQLTPDPDRLMEPHGRAGIFLANFSDFAVFARAKSEPWVQYIAQVVDGEWQSLNNDSPLVRA